jgi:hypothetical protein
MERIDAWKRIELTPPLEPRVVKRRPKQYRLMTRPRAVLRKALMTQGDAAYLHAIRYCWRIRLGRLESPRGLTPSHELSPIVYLMGVTQRSIGLEDRIGGAAPWTTSPASVA